MWDWSWVYVADANKDACTKLGLVLTRQSSRVIVSLAIVAVVSAALVFGAQAFWCRTGQHDCIDGAGCWWRTGVKSFVTVFMCFPFYCLQAVAMSQLVQSVDDTTSRPDFDLVSTRTGIVQAVLAALGCVVLPASYFFAGYKYQVAVRMNSIVVNQREKNG